MIEIPVVALIFVLIFLMTLGLPISWALGAASISAVLLDPNLQIGILSQKIFTSVDNFSMLALPAFFLAGDIMAKGGLSKRLVALSDSLVGWISGGISLVSIVSSAFFAAISGSSVATTAAIGGIMYPEMVKRKYPEDYAAAVQAVGGTLGIVIPPSIVLVIYGNITGTSVSKLLMGGLLPGIVAAIALCIYAYFKAKKENFPKEDSFSMKKFLSSLKGSIWALFMPVIILGGIYAGVFTPTESAVIAVFYGLLICLAIYKEITAKGIWEIIKTTAITTSNLMFLVASAQLFGFLISYYEVPLLVTELFLTLASNKFMFLAIVIVLLLILGMFLEVGATNLILAPILAPIASEFGIDPIQFGVLFVFLLSIGQATPPFGTTLFVASGISSVSVARISRHLFPFIFVLILCAIMFAYIPSIITVLPNILGN